MEALEIHISKSNVERMIFIGIILILLIVAVFAVRKKAPDCSDVNVVVEEVVEEIEVKREEEATEAEEEREIVSYIDIQGLRFSPRKLTIPKDSTVVWTNMEAHTAHKVYDSRRAFISQRMEPGDTYNFTFTTPGTYTYYDAIFTSAMRGTIIVTE